MRQSLFYNKLFSKSLAHVFSCEFCDIVKITFLQNTPERLLLNGDKCDLPVTTKPVGIDTKVNITTNSKKKNLIEIVLDSSYKC